MSLNSHQEHRDRGSARQLTGVPVRRAAGKLACLPQAQPCTQRCKRTGKVDTGPLSSEKVRPSPSVSLRLHSQVADLLMELFIKLVKDEITVPKYRPLKGLRFNTHSLIHGGEKEALIGAGAEANPTPPHNAGALSRGGEGAVRAAVKSAVADSTQSACFLNRHFLLR